MTTSTRERRDWTLLIFIIPIGIILMLIAGQIAIRLVPIWSVNAGMKSELDPNDLPEQQQSGIMQPVLPAILTPLGWFDTFLTPGAGSGNQGVIFPAFVVFEPSATPVVTHLPPTIVTQSPTITATASPTVVVAPPVTHTPKPPVDGTPIPPTIPPTTPPTVATPISTGFPSTPVGTLTVVVPAPAIGTPDGLITNLADGYFVVIDLGSNPINVNGPSDTNYDMVYYEKACGATVICLDQVIIGISQFPNGSVYYTVFNWGNGVPDGNSNVGAVAGAEIDDQQIAFTYLYGTPNQTGVAINVDGAPSAPPVGAYQYIIIQAPTGGLGDGADIDAVQVIELLNPSMVIASISSADTASVSSTDVAPTSPTTDEALIPTVDGAAIPPAETAPVPTADEASIPQAETAPIPTADEALIPPAETAPILPVDEAPIPTSAP